MKWQNTYVKLEKLQATEDPEVPTPTKTGYKYGEYNRGVSVPKGYWITGTCFNEPKTGTSLVINRDSRNGINSIGTMRTSIIEKISTTDESNQLLIETQNSIYLITKLDKYIN